MHSDRALVVFDLDGTLVDSRRDLADSTNEMLATYGAPPLPDDAVARMVGAGARILVERALAASGLDPQETGALSRFREIYDRRLLNFTRPYPGIVESVEPAARMARLAVVTNKPDAPTCRLLDAFDLRKHFEWVIGGDSSFPRKPDPASVQFLIPESGATPATTLFIGDSMIDIETARRAGVRLCLATYGFGSQAEKDALTADDFVATTGADLGSVIERFVRG